MEKAVTAAPVTAPADSTCQGLELSVIIVNWNSKEYVHRCVASILEHTGSVSLEVIVIDSGSFDDCDAVLRTFGSRVRFLQAEDNLGFASANNRAVSQAKGKSLLFLNPDTELLGPAVDILYVALQSLGNVGVLGCRLLNSDGTVQTSCVKAFPTLANELADTDALRRIFPRARLWGMRPLFEKSETASEIDVVSGACMMMRRDVFERIGGFDSRYFVYSEDVDICLKAKRAGFKNYYVPIASVMHHGGCSTTGTDNNAFSSVMALESRWRYFRATRSKLYGFIYRFAMGLVSLFRIGFILMICAIRALRRCSFEEWRGSLSKWVARFRWTIGLESWVKRYRVNG